MKNKITKVNKFVIIFLIVTILVILFTMGLACSAIFNSLFNDDKNENKNSEPIKINDDVIKSESKSKPIKNKYESKEYDITILKVDKDYKEEYMYKKNKDYRVVVVNLEIKNKSNKEITVGNFLAKDNNGKMLNRNFAINSSINTLDIVLPGTILNGSVSFELPKDSKSMTLTYKELLGNNKLDFNIDVNL